MKFVEAIKFMSENEGVKFTNNATEDRAYFVKNGKLVKYQKNIKVYTSISMDEFDADWYEVKPEKTIEDDIEDFKKEIEGYFIGENAIEVFVKILHRLNDKIDKLKEASNE
jgi:hypothetical protein